MTIGKDFNELEGERLKATIITMEHPLAEVFKDVLTQVMYGKGERHGGAAKPFWEQNWASVAQAHGLGFLTGQAQKKLVEAMESGNITANPEAFERELLGAIAYLGMAVLQYRKFKASA